MSSSDDDKTKHTETGAEGGASADTSTPFTPREDDDTPVGDTDQHSKVDHNSDAREGTKPSNAAND